MAGISLSELPSISELSDNDLLLVSKIDQDNQIEGSKKISVANLKNLINECIREKMFPVRTSSNNYVTLFIMSAVNGSSWSTTPTQEGYYAVYNSYLIKRIDSDTSQLVVDHNNTFIYPVVMTETPTIPTGAVMFNPLDSQNEIPLTFITKKSGQTGNNYSDIENFIVTYNIDSTNTGSVKAAFLSKIITVPYDGQLILETDSGDISTSVTDTSSATVRVQKMMPSNGVYVFTDDGNGNLTDLRLTINQETCGTVLQQTALIRKDTKIRLMISGIDQSIPYSRIRILLRAMI